MTCTPVTLSQLQPGHPSLHGTKGSYYRQYHYWSSGPDWASTLNSVSWSYFLWFSSSDCHALQSLEQLKMQLTMLTNQTHVSSSSTPGFKGWQTLQRCTIKQDENNAALFLNFKEGDEVQDKINIFLLRGSSSWPSTVNCLPQNMAQVCRVGGNRLN